MTLLTRMKRFLVGKPLTSQMALYECLPKWKALPVLSSDALSSVAYATEEVLIPLAALSVLAVSWSIPIALAIGILLLIITISYLQTIDAYPGGGGAYTVAKENLGTQAGLVAGASLLLDYILTVAVSVAAGVENLSSAFPVLLAHKEIIGAGIVVFLMICHLRGVKESAGLFAFPTYLFMGSVFLLLFGGIFRMIWGAGAITPLAQVIDQSYPVLPIFLILRSFASGCSALTGIEAISNGIPLFCPPAQKNAKITLILMASILGVFFLGITLLTRVYGILPIDGETTLSQLGHAIFGESVFYYIIQISTTLILILAANTSYVDFPRLASLLAKDRYLPRQLASVGDRLVFSNGILGLSFLAISLIFLFDGDTHRLIPLYAVGVFLSFTLSQGGMVLHHIRKREPNWVKACLFNGLGAITTFVILIVIASTKFLHGAWMVIIFIPFLIFVFSRIHLHYQTIGKELSLFGKTPPGKLTPMKHMAIVPISGIHQGVIDALRYAISISEDVRACYVEIDSATTERVQAEWKKWAHEIPIVVLKSPYRSVIKPLLEYIDDLEQTSNGEVITVIIPEFVTSKWIHQVLHNQTALLIRAALLFKPGKVVTSVRHHLK